MSPLRVAPFISGSGSTSEFVIKTTLAGELPLVHIPCVVSSDPNAEGLEKAANLGIKTEVVERKSFATREDFGLVILQICDKYDIQFIGQYGWMPIMPANVIARFDQAIVNQHPGPVRPGQPDFGGKHMHGIRVHAARLNFIRAVRRDYWTEVTTQLVSERCDEGRPVFVKRINLFPNETADNLNRGALPIEWDLQVRALRWYSDARRWPVLDLEPLIRPGEEEILAEAKRLAIEQYPP